MMRDANASAVRLAISLALLLIAAGFWFLQTYGRAAPDVVAASASPRVFSAARAEQVLARVLGPEKPHPVSTDENAQVRMRIIGELGALGLHPTVLGDFACHSPNGAGVLICASVKDVIAEVKPGEGKAIVLLAHYDSVPAGPGAADDESGVATVIETARALIARGTPGNHPVLAVLTDGEEADLLGAAAFLRDPKWKARVGAVVNVEARGNSGPSFLFQTSAGDGPLIDLYTKSVPGYATSSLYHEIYRFLPNDTDLTLFIADQFPSYNFAYVGGLADYHTARDLRANLDPVSLQQQGDNMVGVASGLETTDFATLHGSDDIYLDILGRWLPRVPAGFAVPLSLLAFLGLLAAVFLARGESYTWLIWLRAFAVTPCLILLALASGFLLHAIAALLSGTLDPAYAYPAAFRIALGFALGCSALLASRLAPAGATLAAVWLWLAGLGIVVAIFVPGLSPYFLIPSLVAAFALLLAARVPRSWAGPYGVAAMMVGALVALLVWSSIGTLGEMIMGFKLHPLFTVPFAFGLSTLVPLLSRCALPPVLWRASSAALFLLALVAAVVQGLEPSFSIAAPQRLSLTYVQDPAHPYWAADASARLPGALRGVAAFSAGPQRISDIGPLAYVAPAGRPRFPLTTATVIAPRSDGALRRITLALHGSPETAQMYVTIPKAAKLRSIDIRGRHFDAPSAWAKEDTIAIACMSRDCANASLTLTLASRDEADIGIYEHRFGLPDFARQLAAARPPTAVPSQNGDGVSLINTVIIPAAQ